MALALDRHHVSHSGYNQHTGVLAQILNTSFNGTSGLVRFKSDGDRGIGGLPFALRNFVLDDGDKGYDNLSLHTVRLVEGRTVTAVAEARWIGDSKTTPVDGLLAQDDLRVTLIPIAAVAGVAILLLLILALSKYLKHQHRLKQQAEAFEADQAQKVQQAIDLGNDFNFCCVTIPATEFVKLGQLVAHEDLRDRGVLVFHDKLKELKKGARRLIFISHQWTSYSVPDHSGQQYKCMVAAVNTIIKEKKWDTNLMHVWCDVTSRRPEPRASLLSFSRFDPCLRFTSDSI
jgi:hypothetical protein